MAVERAVRERRECIRKSADFPVQARPLSQEKTRVIHSLITNDFSESGLQLSSFYFYPVNSRMVIEIFERHDMAPILTMGKVVWVEQVPFQDRYKIGIEFSEMNLESREHLHQLVSVNNA